MKRRTRLLASAVAGIAAMALSLAYAAQVRAAAEAAQSEAIARYGGELVEVCVAARDIEAGESVDENCVVVQEWVASLLPQDAYTALRDLAGKEATSRIPKNAVVSAGYFEQSERVLSVPKGKVAVSVAVDAEHAVGGAVAIDDYVDVYVSKDGVADRLCGARVIDTSVQEGEGAIEWATLAVDPENVSELLAGTARGSISLTVPAAVSEGSGEE